MDHTDEVIDIAECDLGDSEIDFNQAREALSGIKVRLCKILNIIKKYTIAL